MFALEEFDAVVLKAHSGDGPSATYSVVLSGRQRRLRLNHELRKSVASEQARDIAESVGFEFREEPQVTARTGVVMLKTFYVGWWVLGTVLACFLASLVFQFLTTAEGIGEVAFVLLFTAGFAAIFVFGAFGLQLGIKNLQEEANRERSMQSADQEASKLDSRESDCDPGRSTAHNTA